MARTGAYINTQDWMLQACGCTAEALLLGLLASYADEQGNVSLPRTYIAERLHTIERSVARYLRNLVSKGLLELVSGGTGRGDVCKYHIVEKGTKNSTLLDEERVQKKDTIICQKGYKNLHPYNNNILNNNTALKRNNAHARAKDLDKSFTMNTDYNFAEFWELFKPSAEHQSKRTSCLNEWAGKTDEQRAMMLAVLKTGKEHRDNPLFFIRYCDEQYDKVVYTRNEVYKQFRTTEPDGFCILEQKDAEGNALWCKVDDARTMNWPIRRAFGA